MNREIKFRAWDKENKLMSDPVNPFENQNTKFRMDDDYTASVPTSDISSVYGYQHILMQYTGLKDRNGVEIYEGDVCKVTNPYGDVDRLCFVQWDESAGCYPYEPEGGYGDYDISSIGWANEIGYHFEVIGNIYENGTDGD